MKLQRITDNILPLCYDRKKEHGYGVPIEGHHFDATPELIEALKKLQMILDYVGWIDHVDYFLSGGAYVDKPGWHGKGLAIDFDGVVFNDHDEIRVYGEWGEISIKEIEASFLDYRKLSERMATRFEAMLYLSGFGTVLSRGYDSRHEDHAHAQIDGKDPLEWRRATSQVYFLQRTLKAWHDPKLAIDGRYGPKTKKAWADATIKYYNPSEDEFADIARWHYFINNLVRHPECFREAFK